MFTAVSPPTDYAGLDSVGETGLTAEAAGRDV